MESPDEDIANEAIQLIILYSYINLNPKMKKVSARTYTHTHTDAQTNTLHCSFFKSNLCVLLNTGFSVFA